MKTGADLIKRPQFKKLASAADEISDRAGEVVDALADYENADELSGEEATAAREDARESAWMAAEQLLSEARVIEAEVERLRGRAEATS